jgi:hypothetical protein
VSSALLTAAKNTGKLAADCTRYLGRTSLDLVDGGRKLWLRRQRGKPSERAAELDGKLEAIRAGQQTRWNDFHSLPAARKRLIQIASWSAALLAAYALVPPTWPSRMPGSAESGSGDAGSSGDTGSSGDKRAYVWEGEISAKRVHLSADGVANWTANYQVRLREDRYGIDPKAVLLMPLELKYEIEANEVLDENQFGVYPPGDPSGTNPQPAVPHNRSVIGKASGLLRLGENAPDEFRFSDNLDGLIYRDEQAPVPPPSDAPHNPDESEAERYWNSCLAGVPEVTGQPAYRIKINLMSGYGSGDLRAYSDLEDEVLNPLLAGIERSGPDLQEGKGNLEPRSGYAGPVLNFWLCGRLKSADDDEMSGEHAFSSTSNDIDLLRSGPTQVSIVWELERKQVEQEEMEEPVEEPARQQGLAPADLALKADFVPDLAALGEKISYQFAIENKGPADARGVMFVIALGSSAALIRADSSQGECTAGGDSVSCKLGELEKDDTADVTLHLMPRVSGTLDSTANVSSTSPDPDMSNNLENVTVRIQPRE